MILRKDGVSLDYIMSEKELDEILNEIKRNSRNRENRAETQSAPAPSSFDTPKKEEVTKAVENFSSLPSEPKKTSEPEFNLTSTDTKPEKEDEGFNLSDYTESVTNSEPVQPERKVRTKDKKKKSKKPLIIAIIVIVIAAIAAGVYFGFFYHKNSNNDTKPNSSSVQSKSDENTADTTGGTKNPLTGETGYSSSALNQRPVAVVVENEYSTESVRPQWGLSDADIVLEGESEFSTRMLLFWADYNKLPKQVGPTRSARPPFIRFSQLFDAVFIHAGLSKTKGDYIGADTVFKTENVDHINLLAMTESGKYFGRDKTKTSTIEHTGYLNGTNTADLLKSQKIDTKLNEAKFSTLKFNEKAKALSDNSASSVQFKWSNRCPKKGTYTYNTESHKYTTTDFDSAYGKAGVAWENVVFLMDNTQYVVKANYKGSGKGETYCNYSLSGGKGMVLSEGTYVDIVWGVTNGKLWMKNSATQADVVLNPGKTYIGYGSSNNGGIITLNPTASSTTK